PHPDLHSFPTRRSSDLEGSGGAAAGTVLLERALGGVATLVLAAAGFALAVGRYDVGGYLWIELAFVVGSVVLGVLLFSARLHPRSESTRLNSSHVAISY